MKSVFKDNNSGTFGPVPRDFHRILQRCGTTELKTGVDRVAQEFWIEGGDLLRAVEDAVQLLLAGAAAVQVGTATFTDPAAPAKVLHDLGRWCDRHGVRSVSELVGAAHDNEENG